MGLQGKRILITGITGFTGVHLRRTLLDADADVFGITNIAPELSDEKIHTASLEDYDSTLAALEKIKPDFVIHLAGLSFAAHKNPLPYYNINVIGTQNLLDACVRAAPSIGKVILASSAAVYGDPGPRDIAEDHPVAPQSHYGCSKLAMEFIAKSYMDKLPILMTRPFNYTGIGQADHFLIPKIVKHFREKKSFIELGNTNIVREFSDVRDVSNAYMKLLTQPQNGTVNLCSGNGYSFGELMQTLTDLTGHQIETRTNQDFIRPNDIAHLVGDPTELTNAIGPAYTHDLKSTLESMLSA